MRRYGKSGVNADSMVKTEKDMKGRRLSWMNKAIRKQRNSKGKDKITLKDSLIGLYNEECFNEFLDLEKRRCKRSEDPAFLMLADLSAFVNESERHDVVKSMMEVFCEATRDTDVKGWHIDGLVMGILFTEITGDEATSRVALKHIASKCLWRLKYTLGADKFSNIRITWQSLKSEHMLEIHKVGNVGSD